MVERRNNSEVVQRLVFHICQKDEANDAVQGITAPHAN